MCTKELADPAEVRAEAFEVKLEQAAARRWETMR
jgi:hypothetical protein